jgi:hypothetical protein
MGEVRSSGDGQFEARDDLGFSLGQYPSEYLARQAAGLTGGTAQWDTAAPGNTVGSGPDTGGWPSGSGAIVTPRRGPRFMSKPVIGLGHRLPPLLNRWVFLTAPLAAIFLFTLRNGTTLLPFWEREIVAGVTLSFASPLIWKRIFALLGVLRKIVLIAAVIAVAYFLYSGFAHK